MNNAAAEGTTLKTEKQYSKKERILAWLSVPLGYLFCRAFSVQNYPPAALIFTFVLFAYAFVFLGGHPKKPRGMFYPVSALLITLSLFFSGSGVILFFVCSGQNSCSSSCTISRYIRFSNELISYSTPNYTLSVKRRIGGTFK